MGGASTQPECMERGLGPDLYDCSGLIVASMVEVLEITIEQWPQDYRHARQMGKLSINESPNPGDILIYYPPYPERSMHASIFIAEKQIIHASERADKVVQSEIKGYYPRIATVRADSLAAALR